MNGAPVIELRGVGVGPEHAPEALVLREIDWALARGDCWVIGGDQGSGKTLLLRTAAGLQRPAAGTVRIFGRSPVAANEAEQVDWRRRIGFVFENDGRLFKQLTVAENVALPLRYHGDLAAEAAQARVLELLARAELRPYADCWPSELSPRLQKRVSLVRALAVPTEILFLDNPFSGLTPGGMRWWQDYLRELRTAPEAPGGPLTIVASSDDVDAWRGLATRFALIENRRLRMVDKL